jgi:hypothetical protein
MGVAANLRAGDWIEVKSADEILANLDASGCLDGLPFMPEMLQYCGRQFKVYKSAHKTCDTIRDYVIRRMDSTVHLEELRCDGGGHEGCQAGCLLYWKEAWLKRVSGGTGGLGEGARGAAGAAVVGSIHWLRLIPTTRIAADQVDGNERYRCQATEVLAATKEVRRRDRWDPRFYVKDLTSGNVSGWDFVRFGALALVNAFVARWWNRRFPHLRGAVTTKQTPTLNMNIQPGEMVRVRSREEIVKTLDPNKKNRGLFFDVEMVPYCEKGTYKVLSRVDRIIDEKTGKLIRLPNPCLILDGVTCSGMHSSSRMFCPRHVYPFWREIWLKRVEQPAPTERTR